MNRHRWIEQAAVIASDSNEAAVLRRVRCLLRLGDRLLLLGRGLLLFLDGCLLFGLLLLRLGLRDRLLLLAVIVVVATADQRQTGGAHASAGAGAQETAPAHPPAAHPLPVVSLAHESPSRIMRVASAIHVARG